MCPSISNISLNRVVQPDKEKEKNKTHPHWKGKVNLSLQSNLSSQIYPILNHLVL